MKFYIGIILLFLGICVQGDNNNNITKDSHRTPHNIETVIKFLLGKLCYCGCGDPNFPLDDYRQVEEIDARNEYIVEEVEENDYEKTEVRAKEGRETKEDEIVNENENKDDTKVDKQKAAFNEEDDDFALKLLGGEPLKTNGFPWSALIVVGSSINAGGVIITDRHILTAASPIYGAPATVIKAYVGAHDICNAVATGSNASVTEYYIHPSYTQSDHRHNLAILTLSAKLTLNRNVSLICLPPYPYTNIQNTAWVASWLSATTDSPPPKSCVPIVARLPVLTRDECLRAYSPNLVSYEKGCLGPYGSPSQICSGDVGTPVLVANYRKRKFELFGILSDTNSCGSSIPAVFTRVDLSLQWIYSKIDSGCLCKY